MIYEFPPESGCTGVPPNRGALPHADHAQISQCLWNGHQASAIRRARSLSRVRRSERVTSPSASLYFVIS